MVVTKYHVNSPVDASEVTGPVNSVAKVVSVTLNAIPFWLAHTLAQPNLFSRKLTMFNMLHERRKVPIAIHTREKRVFELRFDIRG